MDTLNNVEAPDNAPSRASTIDGTPPYTRAIIDVQNAAIYWQAKAGGSRAEADWLPTTGAFMVPGSRRAPVPGRIYGFRFWAAVKAADLPTGQSQARVTVSLL